MLMYERTLSCRSRHEFEWGSSSRKANRKSQTLFPCVKWLKSIYLSSHNFMTTSTSLHLCQWIGRRHCLYLSSPVNGQFCFPSKLESTLRENEMLMYERTLSCRSRHKFEWGSSSRKANRKSQTLFPCVKWLKNIYLSIHNFMTTYTSLHLCEWIGRRHCLYLSSPVNGRQTWSCTYRPSRHKDIVSLQRKVFLL